HIQLRQSVHLVNNKYELSLSAASEGCISAVLEEFIYLCPCLQRHDLLFLALIIRPRKQHCRSNICDRINKAPPAIRYVYNSFLRSRQTIDERGEKMGFPIAPSSIDPEGGTTGKPRLLNFV